VADTGPAVFKTACGQASRMSRRTAAPVANGDSWRHSAALSEFRPGFLNGPQRSINRKVQSSNLCPGAKFVFENGGIAWRVHELTAT
jgi:hypothetical protein